MLVMWIDPTHLPGKAGEFMGGFCDKMRKNCERDFRREIQDCSKESQDLVIKNLKDNCDPISDYLKEKSITKVRDELGKGNYDKAKTEVARGAFNKKDLCILALKAAISFYKNRDCTLIREATWNLLT